MIDFFAKNASMTKRVTGIAKLKGVPEIHPRVPFKPTRLATFKDEEDKLVSILLEVASTAEERRRGMMGRDRLLPICGMLFDGLSGGGYFWMKDCLIPLDVIFMDKDGLVTKTYSMPMDKAGKEHYEYDDSDVYAIEVNKDFCDKHGIVKGVKVSISELKKDQSNGSDG